jgi:hypothetical protein
VERPHDGCLFGDRIYFTTVDGHIVIASRKTLKVEETVDLNQMSGPSGQVLGWCRGVLPLDERRLWVGFTRVRPTQVPRECSLDQRMATPSGTDLPTLRSMILSARHVNKKLNWNRTGSAWCSASYQFQAKALSACLKSA